MSTQTAFNVPAEEFLNQVVAALICTDVSLLRRLEAEAEFVAPPRDVARFSRNRAVLGELLEATGRNLRLLRRVSGERLQDTYRSW